MFMTLASLHGWKRGCSEASWQERGDLPPHGVHKGIRAYRKTQPLRLLEKQISQYQTDCRPGLWSGSCHQGASTLFQKAGRHQQ
nr:MAG TPA: hypothetical protein [Caudoviricetes sp.]